MALGTVLKKLNLMLQKQTCTNKAKDAITQNKKYVLWNAVSAR